jgi:tetratricopeptide (TPR) repeat protein
MDVDRGREALRRVATEAVARGLLDGGALWDAADRWRALGSDASVEAVFGPLLAEETLRTLGGAGAVGGEGGRPAASPTARYLPAAAPAQDATAPVPVSPFAPAVARTAAPGDARYELGEELGRGAFGRVVRAVDRAVGRTVAVKMLVDAGRGDRAAAGRFMEEARITGQLEHPSVIPIYDLGVLADGQPFYAMRVVPRRSLRDVLDTAELRAEWPLSRLCAMLGQVGRALAYAHARGVVHRDLKPENILLGHYGEVYVADWGIAKVLGQSEIDLAPPQDMTARAGTLAGLLLGTPGYMPPEQALGEWDQLDHRADLFALGAVLYEVLTGQRAFDAPSSFDVLMQAVHQEVRPPRQLWAGCPLVLEDLCLQCLQKRKEDRPPSAEVVAAELEAYLEGAKERARRQQEATRLVAEAHTPVARERALREERDGLRAEARLALAGVKPWEPLAQKRAAWALEDRARAADAEAGRALAEAIELYTKALGYDPDHDGAHAGLAELYWSRAQEAEAERREPARVHYESLVLEHDDGRFEAVLRGEARLSVRTEPPGAHVVARRFVERDRVLVLGEAVDLGAAPVREARLGAGSWLVAATLSGAGEARLPVLLRRGEHADAAVALQGADGVGAGMVLVPAGPCLVGGDDEATDPLPRREAALADFAIGRFPVTFDEYLAFVNDAGAHDRAEAERRLPRI